MGDNTSRQTRFQRLVEAVHVPPFPQKIPLETDYLNNKSGASILWRRLRPWLRLAASGQTSRQQQSLGTGPKRLLWIYKGSPQIGDALMDLSSRILLKDTEFRIDLYTDPHLAELFRTDDIFTRVFSDADEIRPSDYDLVIVDSFKARCLQVKIRHLRTTPFVTMRGYFAGPEFNRTLFSFFRMRQLLGLPSDEEQDIAALAVPHLTSSAPDKEAASQLPISSNAIGFAIGGAEPVRTYQQWESVICELIRLGKVTQIVMLGSENGRAMGENIIAAAGPSAHRIVNCISQFTLAQSFEIIKKCRFLVCCDGGLLHLANAAHVPTVSLFDRQVAPDMRLTPANKSIPLQSKGRINDLPVRDVIDAIKQALALFP